MEVDDQDCKVKLEIKQEYEDKEDEDNKEMCDLHTEYVKQENFEPQLIYSNFTSFKTIIQTVGSENEFVLGIDGKGGVDSEMFDFNESEIDGKGVVDSEIDDIKVYKVDDKGDVKSEIEDTKISKEQDRIKPEKGDKFDDKSTVDIVSKDYKKDPFLWCLKEGLFKTVGPKEENCLNENKNKSTPVILEETSQGTSTENEETCEDVNVNDMEYEDENTQDSSDTIIPPSASKKRKQYFKPRKFICPYCDKGFPQSDILRFHIMTHTGEKPLECNFCCKRFIHKTSLNLHLQIHSEKKYSCKECNQRVASKYKLKLHMLSHEENRPFRCSSCQSAFKNKTSLSKHITNVHGKKEKGSDTAASNVQNSNLKEEPVNSFECDHCKKKFISRENVREHILKMHLINNKKYCCKICGVESPYKYCLRHESMNKESLTCSVCKLNFTERQSFRKHIENVHRTDKPYGCSLCKASFKEKSNLNAHCEVHHNNSTEKFVCNICSMSFKRETYLKRHSKIHTKSDRLFSCDLCSVKCRSKTDIRRHLATHFGTQEKPHQCEHCHMSFTKPGKLLRHQIVHTGEKPYKCNLCEKSYGDKGSLKIHENLHQGKTFKCNMCGSLSINEHSFKRHMRLKICQKKSFICEVCGKTLTSEKFYKKHMMKKHSEDI